jgi:hypothetical protein
VKKIEHVKAFRRNDGAWGGYLLVGIEPPYTRGLTFVQFSRHMKKLLRERYPSAKDSIRLQRAKKNSRRFNFYVRFEDEADEAEFIMTITSLEGIVL